MLWMESESSFVESWLIYRFEGKKRKEKGTNKKIYLFKSETKNALRIRSMG